MRALSVATSSATSARLTQPGYLVEILSSPVLRLSTRSTASWNAQTWVAADVTISGLGGAGNGAIAPRLAFGDSDGLIAAMVLQNALDDAAVRIWAFDGAALGAADPVLVFAGAVAGQSINPGQGVTLACGIGRAKALYSPRVFYGAALGMTRMVPTGTVLQIGAAQYTVERR